MDTNLEWTDREIALANAVAIKLLISYFDTASQERIRKALKTATVKSKALELNSKHIRSMLRELANPLP